MNAARASAARRSSRIRTTVVLVALAAVASLPVDLVWCQSDAGHSALELAGSECCAALAVAEHCGEGVRLASASDGAASGRDGCVDLWLGATGAAPQPPRSPQPLAGTAVLAAIQVAPDPPAWSTLAPAPPAPQPRHVRELIATTVLTV